MTVVLFGVNVPASAAPGADPVADALRAEELGFDFVSVNDHPNGTAPTHEVWTLLSWIAARTTRLLFGPRVLGVPYRPPPVVAKMAASLDLLSGGRLILGLGGGASDDALRAFGLGVPSPREKIDGLEEAVRVMRGLWSEAPSSFDGTIYRTRNADLEPKPARRIPVWLGTYGTRGLRATGRVADGWIPSLDMAPPDAIPAMRAHIEAGAEEAGREPSEITPAYNLQISVDEAAQRAPNLVTGSTEAITEQLLGFTRLGFGAFNFLPVGNRDEQLDALARDVLPEVRRSAI